MTVSVGRSSLTRNAMEDSASWSTGVCFLVLHSAFVAEGLEVR